jgi:hypothetical protein
MRRRKAELIGQETASYYRIKQETAARQTGGIRRHPQST